MTDKKTFYFDCPIGKLPCYKKLGIVMFSLSDHRFFIVHVLDSKFCFLWAKARSEAVYLGEWVNMLST